MQRTVAQAFCAVVGAIGALKLDVDAFVLEEPKLDRRNGDEVGRRIEVGDHKPEHPKRSS